jgi:hypothetical protein
VSTELGQLHGFKEEDEWRLVTQAPQPPEEGMLFRPGATGIVPYVKIDVKNENGILPISSVVIGPRTHMDLAANALRDYLGTLGWDTHEPPLAKLRPAKIIKSSIPFRAT